MVPFISRPRRRRDSAYFTTAGRAWPTLRTRLWLEALEGRHAPAMFTVMNTNDAGAGSLRQAILEANALAGADQVEFDAGVFSISQTISLTTGELTITDSVDLKGPGANLATVSGNNTGRVLNVNTPGAAAAIGISGLTISDGKTAGNGGGIFNQDEALTLLNSVVTNNGADVIGGGLFLAAAPGSLAVQACTVANNASQYGGGGIGFNGGSVTIQGSSISGNTSTKHDGSIHNNGGGGDLLVENSTINGNTGGILFGGPVAAKGLVVRNSTISGNTRLGITVGIFSSTLFVQNCTITNYAGTGILQSYSQILWMKEKGGVPWV